MPASRPGSQQVGGIEVSSDKPTASYHGCVWDATKGMYVPSTVPVVRRHSGATVEVVATYTGTTSGSTTFGWTPTGVAVGDVQIIAVRTAAFGTITPGAGWGTPIQTDSAGSGGGWGHEAIYAKVVAAGDLAAQSASATTSSVWTVHYIRGLASAPVAGDVTATNAVAADVSPYAISAITGSLSAPKFLVVQGVSWPTTSSAISLPPEAESVVGGVGIFSGNNTAFVKSGLIRQAAAATSQAYTGNDFNGENIVIALTPVTAAVSLAPVNVLGDLSDVDTNVLATDDSLFYNSTLAVWRSGKRYEFRLDRPPTTAHAKDDEFVGTALDGKWAQATSTSVALVSLEEGRLYLEPDATGSASTGKRGGYGLRQASPTGSFSVMAKIANGGANDSNARAGIFVGKAAGAATILGSCVGQTLNRGWDMTGISGYSTSADWSSYDGTDVAGGGIATQQWVWWKLVYNASTSTLSCYWSTNGFAWLELNYGSGWARRTSYAQPDTIGIAIWSHGTDVIADHTLCVDWFRVTEP